MSIRLMGYAWILRRDLVFYASQIRAVFDRAFSANDVAELRHIQSILLIYVVRLMTTLPNKSHKFSLYKHRL